MATTTGHDAAIKGTAFSRGASAAAATRRAAGLAPHLKTASLVHVFLGPETKDTRAVAACRPSADFTIALAAYRPSAIAADEAFIVAVVVIVIAVADTVAIASALPE